MIIVFAVLVSSVLIIGGVYLWVCLDALKRLRGRR